MATFLFFAFLLMSGNGVECGSRERRNDDTSIQSLLTLVERQSATIERQAAAMQVMQSQNINIRNTAQCVEPHQHSESVNGVVSRERTQVSFMAQITAESSNHGNEFSAEIRQGYHQHRQRPGYNAGSGVFTAPVTGVYVFYVQLMKASNAHYLHYLIDKSGQGICENCLDETLTYDKSSCLTTVHVQHGKQA